MSEKIVAVERVSNLEDEIVVEFSDGVTSRFAVDFLLRFRGVEGNEIVPDPPSEDD